MHRRTTVTVFAPATIANLGPGFDVLGVAVDGLGDWVTATLQDATGVVLEGVEGDGGKLPRTAEHNTASIAAQEALHLIKAKAGISISLKKGVPLGGGLGSSGASAAAAAWAVNVLFGEPLTKEQLLNAALVAEDKVSGWHADNVGPSLFGGFMLIRSYDPLDIIELPAPFDLAFALVTPAFDLPTRRAREVLPSTIPFKSHVANSGNLAAMIVALFGGSTELLGRAMQDVIVEPARAVLIPGFAEVKQVAIEAGALACSISGAGPTIYALTRDKVEATRVAQAMQAAFQKVANLESTYHIAQVDTEGARVVSNAG